VPELTSTATEEGETESKFELDKRLKYLIERYPVVVFMKGTREEPQCGFSRRIIEILEKHTVSFETFDILKDEAVRQGLKEYSNWKTYPQLYVSGKLIGGVDIVSELAENEELEAILPRPVPKESLEGKLKKLINRERVMLFMKGTPEYPQCGFSRTMIEVLEKAGAKHFGTFDILSDEQVRQGLKTYSNWPTYPQLYIDGKLVGGLDVAREMAEEGMLQEMLN